MQKTTPQKLNITYKQITKWQIFIADMSLCCYVTFYTSRAHVQSVRDRFD